MSILIVMWMSVGGSIGVLRVADFPDHQSCNEQGQAWNVNAVGHDHSFFCVDVPVPKPAPCETTPAPRLEWFPKQTPTIPAKDNAFVVWTASETHKIFIEPYRYEAGEIK